MSHSPKKLKISIVTVCFNSAATLSDTIESVLAQTHRNLEYIVVDGASTDNTVALLKRYEPRFEGRMRWISEPDKGIYDAMNKGIRMATGDVVGVLNSDDFFTSPDIVKLIAERIESHEAVYGDVCYFSEETGKIVRYYSSRGFRPWQMRFGFMPAHPSFYCRRTLYEKIGRFNTQYKIAADFDLLLRFIMINRIDAVYVNRNFVSMRTGGVSNSGFNSHKRIFNEHLKSYRDNGIRSNFVFESLRYPIKIAELLIQRFRQHPRGD